MRTYDMLYHLKRGVNYVILSRPVAFRWVSCHTIAVGGVESQPVSAIWARRHGDGEAAFSSQTFAAVRLVFGLIVDFVFVVRDWKRGRRRRRQRREE